MDYTLYGFDPKIWEPQKLAWRETNGSRFIFGDWRGWHVCDVTAKTVAGPFASVEEASGVAW